MSETEAGLPSVCRRVGGGPTGVSCALSRLQLPISTLTHQALSPNTTPPPLLLTEQSPPWMDHIFTTSIAPKRSPNAKPTKDLSLNQNGQIFEFRESVFVWNVSDKLGTYAKALQRSFALR